MKPSTATALSVGVLVWAWTFTSFSYLEPKVLTWITFLTWASFYAAGGGAIGLKKSIGSGIAGTLASATVLWINDQFGLASPPLLALSFLLGVLGWFLCTISAISILSCIPATFIGAAAFFGAGSPMNIGILWVLCSIVIGALLGLASQRLAEILVSPETFVARQKTGSTKLPRPKINTD